LAAHALAGQGGAELAAVRTRILAGELRVAFVERSDDSPLHLADGRVSGERRRVADAHGAAALLLLEDDGIVFVPCHAGAVSVEPRPSMDPTRPIARVSLRDAPGTILTRDREAVAALRREATVLACAEAVGGIQRTVEMSVEYAKVRQQFGKPIGSFQAVKHRCADMAVRAEAARSATTYAVVSVRDEAADAAFQAAVAKILCANAFLQNAADNVQNHGGMGFTWDCDAHLYVKRARSFDVALGSRHRQLDFVVEQFRAA
jgi:alkylation response protein AidB-like acyl-CoA dehydrogenase